MMVAYPTIRAWSPEERRNLLVSLLTSLTVHAAGLAIAWLAMAWLLAVNQALTQEHRQTNEANRNANRIPTIFVEVTPEQAVAEPPDDTPFYSVANARAANPEPDTAEQPRLEGSQAVLPRTVDMLQPQPELLQPPPPPEVVPRIPQRTAPADLAITSEASSPPPQELRPRPRTLVEARLRQGTLAGPMMRQEGGVNRRGAVSLDVKGSPFGAYDAALIAAVQSRWYDLIESSAVAPRTGRVVVQFTLHEDGRVTDARVVEQEVGEILSLYCRKAITDPSPYAPFPEGMRRLMDRNFRDVRFTFHYF
jgi:outer membrane biosynthesis protein TonB